MAKMLDASTKQHPHNGSAAQRSPAQSRKKYTQNTKYFLPSMILMIF
jgi:hypothetical protein